MAVSDRAAGMQSARCPRRAVLRGAAGVVLAWMTPIRAASAQQAQGPPPEAGDLLVRVDDENLVPLGPDDVPFDGQALMAWAIGPAADAPKVHKLHRIVLARLNPANLSDRTRERAADDIVAYSAVCTHAGCDVDEGLASGESIFCSCHGSSFDARNSGMVISGPATRRLPALPLKLEAGRLVVAGPFDDPPGFGPD